MAINQTEEFNVLMVEKGADGYEDAAGLMKRAF